MYYDKKECGNRIRRLIKSQGYTQSQFADRLNINWEQLKKFLSGKREIPNDLLVEISFVLNVTTDYLLIGMDRERVDVKERLLSVVGELTEIAKDLL